MSFGEILKNLRIERGLTQKELANACNVTATCICQLENGSRNPTGSTVAVLARFFDVSSDYLLGIVCDEIDLTSEERNAGASARIRAELLPIEDDLLFTFREIGKKYGEKGQRAALSTLESLLKLS